MAKTPPISDITNSYSNAGLINDNFRKLEKALDNTVSRDGSLPNNMEADLDLDGNDIINVDNINIDGTLVLNGRDILNIIEDNSGTGGGGGGTGSSEASEIFLKDGVSVEEALVGRISKTIRVPSDYSDWQKAFDAVRNINVLEGESIKILLESDYRPSTPLKVTNGDYRHIILSSENAVGEISGIVTASDNFPGVVDGVSFTNCDTPIWDIRLNMNNRGRNGIVLTGSRMNATPFSGCDRSGGVGSDPTGIGLFVFKGSQFYCTPVVRDGALRGWYAEGNAWKGVDVTHNSQASIVGAQFSSNGTVAEDGHTHLFVSRASSVQADNSYFSGGVRGIRCARSMVSGRKSVFEDIPGSAAWIFEEGFISIANSEFYRCGSSTYPTLLSMVVTGSRVQGGGTILAEGSIFANNNGAIARCSAINSAINFDNSTVTGQTSRLVQIGGAGQVSANLTTVSIGNTFTDSDLVLVSDSAKFSGLGFNVDAKSLITNIVKLTNGGQAHLRNATLLNASNQPVILDTAGCRAVLIGANLGVGVSFPGIFTSEPGNAGVQGPTGPRGLQGDPGVAGTNGTNGLDNVYNIMDPYFNTAEVPSVFSRVNLTAAKATLTDFGGIYSALELTRTINADMSFRIATKENAGLLLNGREYMVSFWAWSEQPVTLDMSARVSNSDQSYRNFQTLATGIPIGPTRRKVSFVKNFTDLQALVNDLLFTVKANGAQGDKVFITGLDIEDVSNSDITPEMFGAPLTNVGLNNLLAWAATAGNSVDLKKVGAITVDGPVNIPNNSIIRGKLKLTTATSSGVVITIGNKVAIDELEFICTANTPASHTMNIGTDFTAKSIYAEALVESEGTFCTIKNQGANVGKMDALRWVRPWNIDGTGGATPMSGGEFGYIGGNQFIRGLSVNFASGLNISNICFIGRAASASQQPGHNGVLQQGGNFNRYGRVYIDGAAEHAFRVGGSPEGSDNNDCSIESLICMNTGGADFKSNDGTAGKYSYRWSIGRIVGRRNFTPASRNTECVRLNKTVGYRIGSISSIPTGTLSSCMSGVQINSCTDLVIGELNIRAAASEIIRFDDSLDDPSGPTSNVVIKNVIGYNSPRLIEISQSAQAIGNVSILNVSTVNVDTLVKRTAAVQWSGPMFIAGVLDKIVSNQGIVDSDPINLDVIIPGSKAYRGAAQSMDFRGSVGVTGIPFNPSDTQDQSVLQLASPVVNPSIGAIGAGISFRRPASGRRGAGLAVVQTGPNAQDTGLGFYTNGGQNASEALALRMTIKHTGDALFSIPGPFANDAAAATGEVLIGQLYRTTQGTVVWRQV